MKIDRNLNIVMRMSDDKGDFVVHTVPLPTDIYSANFRIFRTAYEEMTEGQIKSAINLASVIFLDAGKQHNKEREAENIISELIGATSIVRTTNTLLNNSDLDEDVKQEVINRLIFFIVWEYFVLPTERRDFQELTLSAMNTERSNLSVSQLLSSNTTQNVGSETTSQGSEPTISTAQSRPI